MFFFITMPIILIHGARLSLRMNFFPFVYAKGLLPHLQGSAIGACIEKIYFQFNSRFLLEELIVTQAVEKFSLFNGPEAT
jgi:hypothetical protein